ELTTQSLVLTSVEAALQLSVEDGVRGRSLLSSMRQHASSFANIAFPCPRNAPSFSIDAPSLESEYSTKLGTTRQCNPRFNPSRVEPLLPRLASRSCWLSGSHGQLRCHRPLHLRALS